MADIYVYASNCDDFSNFGLAGALTPTSCIFEEEANGLSEITLEHPIDAFGRHTALACNNIIKADVPVRTTPGIDGNSIVTSIEQWKVKQSTEYAPVLRAIYQKEDGGKVLAILPVGTVVTVVGKSDVDTYYVKTPFACGWMNPAGLEFYTRETLAANTQSIESVQPAWTVKPQLFRIYNVEKGIAGITVSARHISYDLLYNLTTYKNNLAVPCHEALAGIMDNCIAPHEFKAYTNLANTHVAPEWVRKNPIDALLNPETGLATLYKAALVRDNWELYVLHDPGLNRGVTVEYGKNMTGIKYTENYEEVVTRIIPVGEWQNGEDLLLSGDQPWVDSPHINDYPVVYAQELKCEDCKVGTNGVNVAIAWSRMQEQAQNVFDNGGDLPKVEMSVDFINLGDTAEYARFKDLERLFLWDYVLVRHKNLGIDVTSRIVKIEWDCLLKRMNGMEIGSVGKTLANSGITTWQIPTGFSGSKIAGGTVGSNALQDSVISARHLQADSVSAENIQAGTITAEEIKAGEIDAIAIEAVTAQIEDVNAGNVDADRLYAAIAEVSNATIKSADIGFAQVKDLVADQAIITEGVGGQLYIARLAVTEANMVSLTVGELVVKGKDGSFYSVSVDANGNVQTELKQIANDDVKDLSINAGEKIIEGTVTAACLNAQDIFAENAIIKELMAANIDVSTLFAREAFIGLLTTTKIVGDKSIVIMAQDIAANEAAIARQSADLAGAVTKLEGDIAKVQSQVDGSITTWYLEGEPTLTNEPAVNWTTEALKEEHQGDLYYDKSNGYSYRWLKEGNVWGWQRIVDTDVSTALAAAAEAKDTADAKKRIFYTQPTPPYDAGDLWVQGSGGDIYVCAVQKLAGFSFTQSDWKIASKYTDDTAANAAANAANTAQNTANAATNAAGKAQSTADAAKSTADTAVAAAGNAHARANAAYELANGGVASVDVQYYLSTSSTALIGGSWQTVAPEWVDGKYMWQRTVTAYKNGTTTSSDPTCIAGATGATGPAGKDGLPGSQGPAGPRGETGAGVAEIIEEFYLSDSKETQSGGSWVQEMPEWQYGFYVWTRSRITYTDGTVAYTAPYCDTGWEAANDAQTIAANAGSIASAAVEAIGQIPQRLEVAVDGTYIKDENMASIMRLTSAAVTIGTLEGDARGYSQLAANYVQFGNYQLRKSADGGLVFKLKG